MKGVDVIYYLNVPRSTDRREYIETMLSKPIYQDIPVHRVQGMDGTLENVDEFLGFRGDARRNLNMLPTEYGCAISHFRAIHEFAKTNHPVALILEDDASDEFVPRWKKTIQQHVQDAPADWEVLQLSYIHFEYIPVFDYETTDMRKNLCGAAAYLITNAAAKRLTRQLCDGTIPPKAAAYQRYTMTDGTSSMHQADRFLYMFFKTYTVRVPPFTYRDNNDSHIRPEHAEFHADRKEHTKVIYEMEEDE